MANKYLITLIMLAFTLLIQPIVGRPQPTSEANATYDALSTLDSIFKVGPGMMVFHTDNEIIQEENNDDSEFICAERLAGQSYCTEVPNYLETTQLDKIDPAQFEQFSSFFKDDFLAPVDLANRMNEEGEENLCNSKSRIIYPKSVETKEARWVLVVQHAQHKQGVLVEQCENEGRTCKYEHFLPMGISSKCKQHYSYRTLIVLTNGVFRERMVKLPNYCECVLRYNFGRNM